MSSAQGAPAAVKRRKCPSAAPRSPTHPRRQHTCCHRSRPRPQAPETERKGGSLTATVTVSSEQLAGWGRGRQRTSGDGDGRGMGAQWACMTGAERHACTGKTLCVCHSYVTTTGTSERKGGVGGGPLILSRACWSRWGMQFSWEGAAFRCSWYYSSYF